jgi:hypothetical protein
MGEDLALLPIREIRANGGRRQIKLRRVARFSRQAGRPLCSNLHCFFFRLALSGRRAKELLPAPGKFGRPNKNEMNENIMETAAA